MVPNKLVATSGNFCQTMREKCIIKQEEIEGARGTCLSNKKYNPKKKNISSQPRKRSQNNVFAKQENCISKPKELRRD